MLAIQGRLMNDDENTEIQIPEGVTPFYGFIESYPPWIKRFEQRGWFVSDEVKVRWGCHTGWILKNGMILNSELYEDYLKCIKE